MSDMKLFLQLGVKGQSGFTSTMNNMANTTSRSTKRMVASWGSVENRMSSISTSLMKLTALLGGGALLRQAVVDVMNFERGLTEMRLTGELSAKGMNDIRKQMIALSSETLQLPEDQLETFKNMVAAGIKPEKVMSGLKAINRTATASFSNVTDIGNTAIDLFQKMDIKPEKLERAFNIMHKAGKSGRFELKNMSAYFPEVLAAASQYGITGEKGVAQVAAMLQISRRNRAQPAEAASDMKAFLGHMISYKKEFKKVGFNVFDYIDLKSGKFKAGKDIDEFFKDLKIKSKGGSAAMLKAMGIQDYEASNFMAGLMKDWNDYEKIRDEALGAADKNVVGKDFDDVNETTFAKAKRLEIERSKAMKSTGSSWLAEKSMGAGTWTIEHPIAAAGAALGTYAGWKLLPGILQRFIGGGKNSNMGGNFSGGASGVTSVFVVNWPGSGVPIPGALGGAAGAAAGGAAASTAAIAVGVAAIPAIVAAVAGYVSIKTGKNLAQNEASWRSSKDLAEIRARHMVMGGGESSFQVKTIDAEQTRRWQSALKNEIKIDLQIDSGGRVSARSNDMSTSANIGGRRGSFFDALMSTEAM
ncbi:MAG: phage tail tape measure protein [Deltaproteobacteria bacterium]|nr:phage tail tape measure protein [Deltaproteobacteria bacterium]